MIPLPRRLRKHGLVHFASAACLVVLPLWALAQQQPVVNLPDPTPATGMNPAILASPRNPASNDWMAHFQHNVDRTKRGNVNLIFDGDSITDFWTSTGKDVWTKNYGRLSAVDYGISGDRTENMLWRLDKGQVAGLHPRLVAMMIGTNNTDGCTDAQIAEGVSAVVREYAKRCPTAVILLQAILPRAESPTDPTREKITRINQIISKLGDGKKVVYLDFGDKFLLPDGTINRDLMPDTLHPNAKGYEVWADAIRPTMVKIFGPIASAR